MQNADIRSIAKGYLSVFPEDTQAVDRLMRQLEDNEDLSDRTNYHGHVCGSGIVLSPDGMAIALIEHKTFERWQQPGGHMESGDDGPLTTAIRETGEETGLVLSNDSIVHWATNGQLLPIEIALHDVPANASRQEPRHYHYDFRYVLRAVDTNLNPPLHEVRDAAWITLEDPRLNNIAVAMQRLRQFQLID